MAVAALAAFLNPYGLGIVPYFFIATSDTTARTSTSSGSRPPSTTARASSSSPMSACCLLLLLASRRRVGWTEGLLLAAFGFLALLSIRNVIWWGWVTAPGLALSGAALLALLGRALRLDARAGKRRRAHEIPALNWVFAVVLVGAALAADAL